MKYWHELKDSTIKRLFRKKLTLAEVMHRYKQPDWCHYPGALEGLLGCWSLMSAESRLKISREYCCECEYFTKDHEGMTNRVRYDLRELSR